MQTQEPQSVLLGDRYFEVVKPARLREGMVLRAGDIYGRVGPRLITLEEQNHTSALYARGFPVPQVLESGEVGDGQWYFTETSLGEAPFHTLFAREYARTGRVSDEAFGKYLAVIDTYSRAQMSPSNKATISAEEFITSLVPDEQVLPSYCYFGYDPEPYKRAIARVAERLASAPMGILQYDLNPYNIMERGIIDFELVGSGPVGYDTLMSGRWGATWFTEYPSRYAVSYKLSEEQVAKNDEFIDSIAKANGLESPLAYLEEFLMLKSAWAVSDFKAPQPDWPQDKLAFRHFRANVLQIAIANYLAGKPIPYGEFSRVPGGEITGS